MGGETSGGVHQLTTGPLGVVAGGFQHAEEGGTAEPSRGRRGEEIEEEEEQVLPFSPLSNLPGSTLLLGFACLIDFGVIVLVSTLMEGDFYRRRLPVRIAVT
ncbi:hypothetical protein CRG98_046839 [Punica granatum]|uniref:Uncharacterized protein n=1 Tax=Punica granatum TaxID=22663 RepID=A0A2I0HM29_PUNGR|nr:hypothetical protein CRG98_046839 [Punica granatum]